MGPSHYVTFFNLVFERTLFPIWHFRRGDAVEHRFGLWLGFHGCDQPTYLKIVESYCGEYDLKIDPEELRADAIEWQATRGSRSGRVAWQYFVDLAGRKKHKL